MLADVAASATLPLATNAAKLYLCEVLEACAAELVDAALEAAAKATKAGAVAARAGKGVDAGSKKNGGGSGSGSGSGAFYTKVFHPLSGFNI